MACAPTSCHPTPQQHLSIQATQEAIQFSRVSALSTVASTNQGILFRSTMNLHVAHRLRLWRNLQRLCFPAGGPRPMPRLNRSLTLTSAKHDSDHSPAPPSLSGPQPDAQQPLLREEEPQPRVQSAELDIKDSSAGPAQKVLQQGSQTPTADPTKVSESSLPFVCNECGLKFRHRRDLDNHQELSKAERTLLGQTGGCKDRISVAGMKVGITLDIAHPIRCVFDFLPATRRAILTHSLTGRFRSSRTS